MKKIDFLEQEVPMYKETALNEGVYYAVIKDVEYLGEDRIKVRFDLTLNDDSTYTLYLRTNLTPKHSWDMINRLVEACGTRKLGEFIGSKVYVNVVIATPSLHERYENIQDVMVAEDEEVFEYELSEKGYFIR